MFLNCDDGEDSWESLGHKEIKPINPKGNQPKIFIGRIDSEAEAPILWAPTVKTQLTGKDPDAGKDGEQEVKGAAKDQRVGWHHRLNEHEFEQAPEDKKDKEAWHEAIHGVAERQTRLSSWTTAGPKVIYAPRSLCRRMMLSSKLIFNV